MIMPIAWTIAGSDSSGGAGIEADLKTFHQLGVHGCSLITALTAQNTKSVAHIALTSTDTMTALLRNNPAPSAIKIGMLGSEPIINCVKAFLSNYSGHVVMDPVMVSSSGVNLFSSTLSEYVYQMQSLFAFIDVLTPNIPEAEILSGQTILSSQDVIIAAEKLLAQGVKSVLIKGGHANGNDYCHDYWMDHGNQFWLTSRRHHGNNYRGTGCVMSSAITAALACGYDIMDALVIANMYCQRGIRLAHHLGEHAVLLSHFGWPSEQTDLPYLSTAPITKQPKIFPDCGASPLGVYPVVDDVEWVRKLLPLGIKTIQLRIKDKTGIQLERQIQESIALANRYQARLFINDYWELALKYHAYGVHLGQSDLHSADVTALHNAGLRLGVSTHCYYEIARAHALHPSYLACGPIYHTTSKQMPFQPQGISQLVYWRKMLNYSLIAIGGIGLSQLREVAATKVDGIAMISAVTKANDWEAVTREMITIFNRHYI